MILQLSVRIWRRWTQTSYARTGRPRTIFRTVTFHRPTLHVRFIILYLLLRRRVDVPKRVMFIGRSHSLSHTHSREGKKCPSGGVIGYMWLSRPAVDFYMNRKKNTISTFYKTICKRYRGGRTRQNLVFSTLCTTRESLPI